MTALIITFSISHIKWSIFYQLIQIQLSKLKLLNVQFMSARARPNDFISKNDYPNLDIAVNDNVLKYVTDIDLKAFGTINLSSK